MPGRRALRIADAVERNRIAADGDGVIHRNAVIYAWKPAAENLESAAKRSSSFRYTVLKRGMDVCISLALIVFFLPLGLLIALLIKLSSTGPVFYCEERIGRFRVPFKIIKFRSMYTHCPPSRVQEIRAGRTGELDAIRLSKKMRDPRITPLGRMLRRLSLDELPQLINVFWGDMSLVGPRPIVKAERRFYGWNMAYYDLFSPGITGLWQVSGRSDVDYDGRVQFDKEYASQWSCLLDFAILARTIPAVVTMRGAY